MKGYKADLRRGTGPGWTRTRGVERSAVALLLAAAAFVPAIGTSQVRDVRSPPSVQEKLQLPEYCQWQMDRENPRFQAPQFRITHVFPNCGVGTNHYCPGLLAIVRANRAGADRSHRRYWIERAGAEFQYTSKAIQPYPNCGLREPLNQSLKQLEIMARTSR